MLLDLSCEEDEECKGGMGDDVDDGSGGDDEDNGDDGMFLLPALRLLMAASSSFFIVLNICSFVNPLSSIGKYLTGMSSSFFFAPSSWKSFALFFGLKYPEMGFCLDMLKYNIIYMQEK